MSNSVYFLSASYIHVLGEQEQLHSSSTASLFHFDTKGMGIACMVVYILRLVLLAVTYFSDFRN